jgi:hypothetical protein
MPTTPIWVSESRFFFSTIFFLFSQPPCATFETAPHIKQGLHKNILPLGWRVLFWAFSDIWDRDLNFFDFFPLVSLPPSLTISTPFTFRFLPANLNTIGLQP